MNLSMKLFAGIAAVALLSELHSAASANLLTNPGFEDPNPPAAGFAATDWPEFQFAPATVTLDSSMPHSGQNELLMEGSGSSTTGSGGAFQRVLGIAPGTSYTFSIWAKVDALPIVSDDANGGALMRIEWHSDPGGASSQIIADTLALGPLLTTDYQLFSVTAVAPAGTGHARTTITHRHNSQTVFI